VYIKLYIGKHGERSHFVGKEISRVVCDVHDSSLFIYVYMIKWTQKH